MIEKEVMKAKKVEVCKTTINIYIYQIFKNLYRKSYSNYSSLIRSYY